MPSENSITTTEPLRGARTRRPATAREPRPSFRSTTCTGVTLARSIVESTGQLPRPHQYGYSQVREMSADVRAATISPKTERRADFEQWPRQGQIFQIERLGSLRCLIRLGRFELHRIRRRPAVAALGREPQPRLVRRARVVAEQLHCGAAHDVEAALPSRGLEVGADAAREHGGLARQ